MKNVLKNKKKTGAEKSKKKIAKYKKKGLKSRQLNRDLFCNVVLFFSVVVGSGGGGVRII